jgi:hypothetical protein
MLVKLHLITKDGLEKICKELAIDLYEDVRLNLSRYLFYTLCISAIVKRLVKSQWMNF